MSSARAAKLPLQNSSISNETPKLPASAPSIALISAAPFMRLCKLQGTQTFHIHLSDISVSANSASVSEEALDLSNIPEEYHDFANVFSKAKAEKLALHWPYNLKINLEEGTSPLIVPMYPLSQSELEVLCNFLDDHLRTRFICQTSSSHGALVIFALKKDKTLCLCIDLKRPAYSFRQPFTALPKTLPCCSLCTCSPNTAFWNMSLLTTAPNSSPAFSAPSEKHLT